MSLDQFIGRNSQELGAPSQDLERGLILGGTRRVSRSPPSHDLERTDELSVVE
jgi:hypothetical protein